MSSNTSILDTFPIDEKDRYEALIDNFFILYASKPTCIIRAPGRVNLIGEHIDYSGYGVLPMAIDQDILIAAQYTDDHILHISNVDKLHSSQECAVSAMSFEPPIRWYHYVYCGVSAVLGEHGAGGVFSGARLLVDGRVPLAAGLSSSSALVCCSTLMAAYGVGLTLDKVRLADISKTCERYVGVQGGGMDQAISMLAVKGKAKLIEFDPLRSTDVTLPQGASFVIANTCVEARKAVGSQYNMRVMECRLAAKVIAVARGGHEKDVHILADLERVISETSSSPGHVDDEGDLIAIVDCHLHEHAYGVDEIRRLLNIDVDTFSSHYPILNSDSLLQLHARARHVFEEKQRVVDFKAACDMPLSLLREDDGDKPRPLVEEQLDTLGSLMNDSHDSCRYQFDCSCDELDELVDVARRSGAKGSRLTGAGWGGCVVSLVATDRVKSFLESLHSQYYEKTEYRRQNAADSIFVSQPGGGACVYKV